MSTTYIYNGDERTERAVKMARTRNLPREGLSGSSLSLSGNDADVDPGSGSGSGSDLCGGCDASTFSSGMSTSTTFISV